MLFEPTTIKGVTIKNRIVRSATYEKMADNNGFVTEGLIKLYEKLTLGGSGLIITGNAIVHRTGISVPQAIRIDDRKYLEGLKNLTEAVHRLNGIIFIQLVHGGRQCYPALLDGDLPIAPSEVFEPLIKVMPRAMKEDEITMILEAFGKAAKLAKDAQFDGIQLHGAHGYLISEFLSPHTNRRDDNWGGDRNRRVNFIEQVILRIRSEVGSNYPLFIKLNSDDYIQGGLDIEESAFIAKRLADASIDAIEVSGGMYESDLKAARDAILKPEDEAYFRAASKKFKALLNIPIMLVGGIRSKSVASSILENSDADLISMSRPLVRQPDLPKRFMDGTERADCISCNGCMRFRKLQYVECVKLKAK
ncbi:NADH oxidase [Candidatus Magnetoovum chiemensis]|nr:NADH oxidase [Candidatus Magnetoovum chiemensis]